MALVRLISRLDIKGPTLIKGIQLEGLRQLGRPEDFAKNYYEQGIDEIIYMDAVASLYNRNGLSQIIEWTAKSVFVPITVGGGIRSLDDALILLRSGADKIAINTAAIRRPGLISEISRAAGSQCMVLSIEAKEVAPGKWEAFVDNGRERTGRDVVDWVMEGERLGAGEILLTSVDKEGTRSGAALDLIKAVTSKTKIPVIYSGGIGKLEHIKQALNAGSLSAVAMADLLHYKRHTLEEVRKYLRENEIRVRAPL